MYCSTCGSRVPTGRRVCETCGTVQIAAMRPLPGGALPSPGVAVGATHLCPRCGYDGFPVSYFSRGSRLAALVGVTMLSAGVMGAGGLIYYLVRKDHVICVHCGHNWSLVGQRGLVRARPLRVAQDEELGFEVKRESAKRAWSILLFVLAVMMLVTGIVELEIIPIFFGIAAGAGGLMLRRAANQEREERRAALIASLQGPVVRLAAERGGSLTVSDVAASLGWTMPRAEKVLHSLDDGVRVDSEVTDEGLILYHFLELSQTRRLPEPDA